MKSNKWYMAGLVALMLATATFPVLADLSNDAVAIVGTVKDDYNTAASIVITAVLAVFGVGVVYGIARRWLKRGA